MEPVQPVALRLFECDETEWRPVVGFEHTHRVSRCGKVKVLSRRVSCKNGSRVITERVLSPTVNTQGYAYCRFQVDNRAKSMYVHRMVADAFCHKPEACESRLVVNHIDHDKLNNEASNLEWVSDSENARKRWVHYGEQCTWQQRRLFSP